jgi:hypothetical protein
MAVMQESSDLPRWARLAIAATGVVGTGVFLLVVFSPNLPMYGDSLNDWSRWAATHQSDARHDISILFIAYMLYMVFGVYVATLMRTPDASTGLLVRIATVAIGAKFAIEMMQIAVLSLPAEAGSQDFNRSMAQLGTDLSVLSLVPFAVFLLAVGAAALISRVVPVWLAWFTFTVGAIHALAVVLGLTGAPNLGPILVAYGFAWFTSIPAWPLVTAVCLLVLAVRDSKPVTETGSAVAAAEPA